MKLKAIINSECSSLVEVEIEEDNKEMIRRSMSYCDFYKCLNKAALNETMFHLGKLPHGYVDSEISLMDPSTFTCVVRLSKEKRLLLYYGEVFEVPFPELIFKFGIVSGNVTYSVCYACVDNQLYHYPYGNVHMDGKICWGNIRIPSITTLADVDILVSLFLASATNDDLFISMNGCATQRALVAKIKHLEDFPINYLKEANVTLSTM